MSKEDLSFSQNEKGNNTKISIPEGPKPEGFKQEKAGLCDQTQDNLSELGRELMKIDKFSKKELAKVYSKGGLDSLKKLSEARTKSSENDKKYIMEQFGYSMSDRTYALDALKIVRAVETEKLDLNQYFNIKQEVTRPEVAVKTNTLPEFAKNASPEEKAMITELQQKGFEVREEGSGRSSKVTLYREGKLVGEASSKFGIGLGLKNLLNQVPYILDPTLEAREKKVADEKYKAEAAKRDKELAAQDKIEEKYPNLGSLITIEGDRGWIKNLKINPKFENVLKNAKTKGIKLVDNNSRTNGFAVVDQEGKNLGEVRVFMNVNWQNDLVAILEKVPQSKTETTKKEKKGKEPKVAPKEKVKKPNVEAQKSIDESAKRLREMTGGKDEKPKFTSNDDLFTDFDFNKKPKVKVNEEYYKNRGLEEYKKGVKLYDQKKYTEAVKAFDEAIRLSPSADAQYNKGLALYNLGKINNESATFDEAVKAFDEAIKLNPKNSLYHFYKGSALYAKSDYTRAITAFDEVIKLDPNNANAYYNKGLALSNLGRYNEASKTFNSAIRLDPENEDYYGKKMECLKQIKK